MLPAFLRRSVRGKMLALVLATTLTALLANAAALLYYNIDDYRRTRLADVRTQAEILGRASAAALASGSGAEAERDLAVLQARPDVVAAALYGRDGKLLAAYRRDPEAAVPAQAEAPGHRISGDRLRVFHPVVDAGDTAGNGLHSHPLRLARARARLPGHRGARDARRARRGGSCSRPGCSAPSRGRSAR